MLSTLESLLRAMTAYFNYKAEQSKYELFRILEDTEDKIKKIKNEIKDAHDRGISMMFLNSCTPWPKRKNSATIYQTEFLEVEKGTKIQAKRGIYTPQVDEKWYSKAYVDKILINRIK